MLLFCRSFWPQIVTARRDRRRYKPLATRGPAAHYCLPNAWTPRAVRQNGYCKSFNARFRDELLNGESFCSLREAQILTEEWRRQDNTKRPHGAMGYRPPAPESFVPMNRAPIIH
nr:integrase core domain-containing protein [Rhodovulum sulfidophilum]